jgi:hypothetical protein
MKRIPYSQLVIGLDKLFFGDHIDTQEQAEQRADTIDAYLEACGWNWDSILEEMCREETGPLQTKPDN